MFPKKKLLIISSHPIQYNAPLFKLLAEREVLSVMVFYTWSQSQNNAKYDPDFGFSLSWDIPLTEGYQHKFMENVSKKPGSDSFFGVINPGLIREVKQYDPDFILVYGWNFYSHLRLLIHFKGKKRIYFRGDSTLLNYLNLTFRRVLRDFFLTIVYKFIDKAFYVGTNNKQYYKRFGLKEQNLVFAPHCIDNRRFVPFDDIEKKRIRMGYGIPEEEIVVLYAGKFEPRKNPLCLVEAFLQLKDSKVRLVMVGNGILENEVKCLSAGNRQVTILPFQNQSIMPSIYNMADIFVLPSQSETWGLSLNEAMSVGLAVIASTQCGAAVDLIKNGENGYIFNSGDSSDLLEKMKMVLLDYRKMGEASSRIIQNWSVQQTAVQIENELLSE